METGYVSVWVLCRWLTLQEGNLLISLHLVKHIFSTNDF